MSMIPKDPVELKIQIKHLMGRSIAMKKKEKKL